jgi:hypothetical protein
MMTSDQAREPVLERSMPAGAVPGSTVAEDTDALVQLQDGTWLLYRVIGQRKDRHGRWCVEIRYYVSSFGEGGGWYLLDRRYLRRLDFEDGGLPPCFRARSQRRPSGLPGSFSVASRARKSVYAVA